MDASVLSSSQHAPDGGAERSSSRDGAHVPFQATNETERGVWRYFESYKRSAILHAEQYLRYSTVGQDDQGSFVDAGPPGPGEYFLSVMLLIYRIYRLFISGSTR